MDEVDREREQIEVRKAQVDRYKQLQLKQRDIMVALTQRRNERDEQIVALQDELVETEKRHAETQEHLDKKTADLIHAHRLNEEMAQSQSGTTPRSRGGGAGQLEQQLLPEEQQGGSRTSSGDAAEEGDATAPPAGPATQSAAGLEARVRALTKQVPSLPRRGDGTHLDKKTTLSSLSSKRSSSCAAARRDSTAKNKTGTSRTMRST